MQKKIRNAQVRKVPYMLVVGDKEVERGEVAVRLRSGVDLTSMPVERVAERMISEIANRRDTTE